MRAEESLRKTFCRACDRTKYTKSEDESSVSVYAADLTAPNFIDSSHSDFPYFVVGPYAGRRGAYGQKPRCRLAAKVLLLLSGDFFFFPFPRRKPVDIII